MAEANIRDVLRNAFTQASKLMEFTVKDLTHEQLHWIPAGNANPIGATYAHVLISQDGVVNAMLRNSMPLYVSTEWQGKLGLSELPPMPGQEGLPDWSGWSRRVQIDLEQLREYAKAVYASTDKYLASLSDEDLFHAVDATRAGMSEMPLMQYLLLIVLGHTNIHAGEISCLRGELGLQGFPV